MLTVDASSIFTYSFHDDVQNTVPNSKRFVKLWLEQAAAAEGQHPEDAAKVAAEILETQCEFHVIYPTLFASLRLNHDKRSALIHEIGEDNFKIVEQYTNGYTLLGLQDRLGVKACASTVANALDALVRLEGYHLASTVCRSPDHVPDSMRAKAQIIVNKRKKRV